MNAVRLLQESQPVEKEGAALIYTTAFIRLMREGGYLYKRILEPNGTVSIVMTVDGKEYKCQESLILYYTEDTLNLLPYEDNTMHLNEIGRISRHDILTMEEQILESERKKISLPDIELPRIQVEKATPFEELPEAPELTLTEDQQADYIMDETERYKIGAGLNFILGLACIVFTVIVMTWT